MTKAVLAYSGFGRALRVLLDVLTPRRKRQLGLLTLLTLANGIADLLMVAAAMVFLAAMAGSPSVDLPGPLGDWLRSIPADGRVSFGALLFGASAVAANAVRLIYLRSSESYIAQVSHELTMEVHRRVFAQPYDYHVRHHSSELLGSLEIVQRLASNLIHQWLQSIAALASGIAIVWLLVSIDPIPAIAAFAVLGLFYMTVAQIASRRLKANSNIVGDAYSARIRKVQESLGAIRDLKIDHTEAAQLADFEVADRHYVTTSANTMFIAAAPRYLVEAGAVLIIAGLAVWLAARGESGGLLLIGGIALGGMRVLPLLQQAYRSWAMVTANRNFMDQVVDLLGLPLPQSDDPEVEPLPFMKSIQLDHVGFRYPERPEPALSDVTLTIERGCRLGIVGETGSGKSTLVDVIMGLLLPQAGTIRIDDQQLGATNIRAWQQNIAHVSQSIFLTDASFARNIAFSVPAANVDMERVRLAAERAEIAAFIDSLPDEYETPVGERGVRLSGGQRQRVAIARAIYKNAPFMILDEATSALDERTEAKVLANLFADPERTVLIIAHRPSAIALCDQIVELDNGCLVSSG